MLSFLVLVVLASAVSGTLPHRGGRIIGGEDTTIETYPYQVSLEIFNRHNCGASIISAHYIITAGHCVGPVQYLTVRAGTSKQGNGGSVHKVTEVHRHEEYGTNEYGIPVNDIAIMRVEEPFVFDDTRQPIKLYETGEEALAGLQAVITGWGETGNGAPIQLQTVAIPIIPKELCHKAYEYYGGLPKNQICAAYYGVGGKDACQGDSGGPLAINGRLAGVTSWGNGCAEPEYPGAYTEVAAYRDWIIKIAKLE